MAFEKLREIPRVKLCNAASPLEAHHNLARLSGAKNFLIKRDDTNCFATGGNKARHMEYYLGDVMKQRADTLILLGGRVHNLSRMAAAACAKYGIECHILIEEGENGLRGEPQELRQILASNMLDAHIYIHSPFVNDEEATKTMQQLATSLAQLGASPYILQSDTEKLSLAAFGYIHAAIEIVDQLDELDQEVDAIFCAVGSGNTVAGLLYGLRSLGCDVPVIGVSVGFSEVDHLKNQIRQKIDNLAAHLEEDNPVDDDDILVTDAYCESSYTPGYPDPEHPAALAAKYEGLMIDPFFNAKSISAAFEFAKQHPDSQVMLLNTGNITPNYFEMNSIEKVPNLLQEAV